MCDHLTNEQADQLQKNATRAESDLAACRDLLAETTDELRSTEDERDDAHATIERLFSKYLEPIEDKAREALRWKTEDPRAALEDIVSLFESISKDSQIERP